MDPAHRRRDHRRGDRRLVGRHPHEVGAVHRPLMGIEKLLGDVQNLVVQLTAIANVLFPFAHPNLVVKALLDASVGLLLKVWFGLILHTTDFETGREFTANSTIQVFESKVQLVANAALTLVVIWASYRVMWGHGLRSQFTARILLPRLMMSAVLMNFALPFFFSSRRRHTRLQGDWSSDVCSSD